MWQSTQDILSNFDVFLLLHYFLLYFFFCFFFHFVFIIFECCSGTLFRSEESARPNERHTACRKKTKDGGRSRNERKIKQAGQRESISLFNLSYILLYILKQNVVCVVVVVVAAAAVFVFVLPTIHDGINCVVCAHTGRDGVQPSKTRYIVSLFFCVSFIFILSWKKGREARRIKNSKWYSFYFASHFRSWIYYEYCYCIHIHIWVFLFDVGDL